MTKRAIRGIHEKNAVIERIIGLFESKKDFLVLGHASPDEDCIASMVGVSLILSKLAKNAHLFLNSEVHEHFRYLLDICGYNSIALVGSCANLKPRYDAVVVCDTPKIAMVESIDSLRSYLEREDTPVVEIDHHVGGDSRYIGREGLCLVTDSSSSSELVGHIAFKIGKNRELLSRHQIDDLFSRNLVLAILTGIIGDTNMGQYLGSRREKRYYTFFTEFLNRILVQKTVKDTNFATKEQIFEELKRHTHGEQKCYDFIMAKKRRSSSVGYVILSRNEMMRLASMCGKDTTVSVTRAVANRLAEESERLGLVVYTEAKDGQDIVQFRLRRSSVFHDFDLRSVLEIFAIGDGGGHEGAIGFRIVGRDVPDVDEYVAALIEGIDRAISSCRVAAGGYPKDTRTLDTAI